MRRIFWALALLTVATHPQEFEDIFQKPREYPTYTDRSLTDMVGELEENLNNPEFLYNYAWLAYEEGDYETATNYIEKALALRPQNAFLQYKAGLIYLAAGDRGKAQSHFEKALENHYEYYDVWLKLVELDPQYYYHLAQLFGEKAHQLSRSDLADEAIRYYRTYIEKNPGGEFLEKAQAGIRDMELLKSEIESRERIQKQKLEHQKELAERKLALLREREEFRTTRRRVVGLFFDTFSPTENYLFSIRDEKRQSCITQRIYLKDVPGGYESPSEFDTVNALGLTSLSEFSLGAGYFVGPFILRGNVIFGRSNVKWNYLQDTLVISIDTFFYQDTIPTGTDTIIVDTFRTEARISKLNNTVASVNTMRFGVEALYNFYYASPLLLYLSAGADVGYVYLAEKESYFESVWISGFGVGAGAMLRFGNVLLDISYRRNLVGESAGGFVTIGGMYKF